MSEKFITVLGRFSNTGGWGREKERIKILFHLRLFVFKFTFICTSQNYRKCLWCWLYDAFFMCKIIVCVLLVLQLYLTSLIKISYHVIIRNRCFNIPSAIDVNLYVNHFSVEFIIFWRVRRTTEETEYKLRHVCLSSFFCFLTVCWSLHSHGTIVFLLNGFREILGCGFLLKSVDQIHVLLK